MRAVPKALCASLIASSMAISAYGQVDRVALTPQAGYTLTWDGNNGGFSSPDPGAGPTNNDALAVNGTVAFGSSQYGTPHFIANVNDGYYGNASSWISDFTIPDPNPYIGLNFNRTVAIQSIAWSRDNGDDAENTPPGPYVDRCVGTYTLQVTTVANPGTDTQETGNAATGWATIGTVQYKDGADTINFSAYLRHRFDVSAGGQPISATGIRIKVSDPNTDIDEIEVNPGPDPTAPITNFIVIQPATTYAINWDGNNGKFNTPASPAAVPQNRALAANGTTAFGSSEFGQGVHYITNVIDGLYGNSHCWISDFTKPDSNPYVGLNFGGSVDIKTVAWSRDNGDDAEGPSNPNTDRAVGLYTLQITQVENPGTNTAETGDPTTGWVTVGTFNYRSAGTVFVPYLRHRYEVSNTNGTPITATGLRLRVSDPSMAIDEIEVNADVIRDYDLVKITPEAGYSISWDGNEGVFFNSYTNGGYANVPDNDALASKGGTAFGSSELADYGHIIAKVVNGLYGNEQSWIPGPGLPSTDTDPFIGVNLGKTIMIHSIAWGRDNRGQYTDRSDSRTYTLQVTTVLNPGLDTYETGDPTTGWVTIGTVQYALSSPPDFVASYRHRFDVAQGGNAIAATGLRIKVSMNDSCIDEIEVNPAATTVSIQTEPADIVAAESGPVTYSVKAVVAGEPSPVFYQWQ
ncbi:MAG: hypothetical protein M1608_02115, partial [Candidatus Omnitrophica bacterium]|nr:hypothetical protein [Candidatus Omnitrophota bacterium]